MGRIDDIAKRRNEGALPTRGNDKVTSVSGTGRLAKVIEKRNEGALPTRNEYTYATPITPTTAPTPTSTVAPASTAQPATPFETQLVPPNRFDMAAAKIINNMPYSADDFAEKSRYVSTATGKPSSTANMSLNRIQAISDALNGEMGKYVDEKGRRIYQDDAYGDLLYEWINQNQEAGELIRKQDETLFGGNDPALRYLVGKVGGEQQAQRLTDQERGIFNYIYNTRGRDAAYDYYYSLTSELNERNRAAETEAQEAYAQEHPVGAALKSILQSPLKGLSYASQAADYLTSGTIDQNAPYNKFSYVPNAAREEVSEKVQEKWGPVGSLAYDVAMSLGDFLLAAAVSGRNQPLTLAIMGAGAAADTVIAKKDQGYSDQRAFILGTIAGIGEAATEKIGFDALFNSGIRELGKEGFKKYVFRNMGAEGAEEGASDLINWIADDAYDVITGTDESEWKKRIYDLMADGKSESEAFGVALGERAAELGRDVLVGSLSGGVMAGVGGTVNERMLNRAGGELRAQGDDVLPALIESGLESETPSQSYRFADELRRRQEAGENISNTEVAQLYQANVQAMRDERDAERIVMDAAQEAAKGRTISNRTASSILNDANAVNLLKREADLSISDNMSRAEQRRAVKSAISTLVSRPSEENSEGVRVDQSAEKTAQNGDLGASTQIRNTMESVFGIGERRSQQAADMYNGDVNANEYAAAYSQYYRAGVNGADINEVMGRYTDALNIVQKQAAYLAGQADASRSLADQRANVQNIPVKVDGNEDAYGYIAKNYGSETADRLVRIAGRLGVSIRFADEVAGGAANAQILGADILVEKGNKNPIAFLLGHEFTHRMQDLAPEEYRRFRDAIANDPEVQADVKRQMEIYSARGRNLKYEQALDEAAANYAGRMMEDEEFLDRFLQMHKDDRTLLEKIRDTIRAIAAKLTGADKKKAQSVEAKLTATLNAASVQARENRDRMLALEGTEIKKLTSEEVESDVNAVFSMKDAVVYNDTVVLKESTIDKYLEDYASEGRPEYAQAYIAYMSPRQFLDLTTTKQYRSVIEQETGELDVEALKKANTRQPMFLIIDHETGEVTGHEGRHRIMALSRARVWNVPVLLFDYGNKYSKTAIDSLTLQGQDFGSSRSYATATVHDIQPLSYGNRDTVISKFATQPSRERDAEILGVETVRYSAKSLSPIAQNISSAGTSIKQVPALFRNKDVHFGKTNIDIGGGRFDLATDYLKSIGTKNYVFDPYNRGEETNSATLKYLQSGKKADTATCANVLNVIAEPAARANVILETAKAIKDDGTAYFMVYEGDGSGEGKQTSAGYQNNRKTADYVGEIEQYFDDVTRKGKLIIAKSPKANLPEAAWEISPGKAIRYSIKSLQERFGMSEEDARLSVKALDDLDGVQIEMDLAGLMSEANKKDGFKTVFDAIKRELIYDGGITFVGRTFKNIDEIAAAANVFRDPRFETVRYFFVDENGKVVMNTGYTTRLPGATYIIPGRNEAENTNNLRELMRKGIKAGAVKVYMAHNHPSGNVKVSQPDFSSAMRISELANRMSLDAEFFVIDHKKYAVYDSKLNSRVYTYSDEEDAMLKPGDIVDNKKAVVKSAMAYNNADHSIVIVYANTALGINGIEIVDESVLTDESFRNELHDRALDYGAPNIFAVGVNISDESKHELVKLYEERYLTDAVYTSYSLAEVGMKRDRKKSLETDAKPNNFLQDFRKVFGYDGVSQRDETVVWDNRLIKSAEPIAYDDSGNIIPLSERFNSDSNDVRYSLKDAEAQPKKKRMSAQERRDAGLKLTESQFYSLYSAHKIYNSANRDPKEIAEIIRSIREEGFTGTGSWFGANLMPTNQTSMNASVRKYGPRKGETILLVPKSGAEITKNYDRVRIGYKPMFDYEFVKADYDFQPYYEMYSKAYDEAQQKFSLKGSENTRAMDDLARENEYLRTRVDFWKSQLKPSDRAALDPNAVARTAKALVNEYGISVTSGEQASITKEIGALYDYLSRGGNEHGDVSYDEAYKRAFDIANKMLDKAVAVDDELYQRYADLRSYLRQTKIYISETDRHDIPDFNDFRKRNFGRIKIANDGTPIDSIYQELAEMYPELFNAEENTHPADQLERIAEVLDDLYAVAEYNPYAADMEEAATIMAGDMIDRFFDVPQVAKTFADRAADRLTRQKIEDARKLADLREKKNAQIEAIKARGRERTKEAIARTRAQKDEQIRRLKEHYAEMRRNRAERRADSAARTRLLKIARRLSNKKLPEVNRALLEQYIGDLDLVAKSMTGETLDKLSALEEWYRGKLDPNSDTYDPDFLPDARTEATLSRLHKKHISELTAQEVADLTDALLNIENEIRTKNKLIDEQDRRDTYAMGVQTIKDVYASRGSKGGPLDKYIITETLSPIREMRRIVGYTESDPLYKLMRSIADGQRKMFDYQMRAGKPFEWYANDKFFNEFMAGKKAFPIKVTGQGVSGPVTVTISPAMRASLYLHSLNPQNMRHIKDGGITVPDWELYRKGEIEEAYNRGTTIKLTPSLVRSVTIGMSEEEKAYARLVHAYFNGQSRDEINEVSEKLKGYSVAQVENYFPINTDRSFLRSDFESIKFDGSIEGMGFLKERVNAVNPIMLRDITDVLKSSIDMHSKYVGLAIPIRNFNKVWGVTTSSFEKDANGKTIRSSYESSVQQAIKQQWGTAAYRYIEKVMRDLQNSSPQKNAWLNAMNRVRGNYAKAVLTLNASVAMKQAASYPTAAAVIGWKPLAKAMGNIGKVDLDLIAKYTPIQWYRSQGFSTKELGDLARDNRQLPKILNWIQGIDLLTTRKLWKACEYYVQEQNRGKPTTNSEYYNAVADVYNRVIEETQPNYTLMQRPQLLRSDDTFLGNIMMFKTQPFQNFNILYDAAMNYDAKRRNGSQEEQERAKKALSLAITSQLAQLGVFAGMTMLWALFRGRDDKYRDEDGNLTILSVLKALGKDMIGNSLAGVPFGSEAWEFASSKLFGDKYYGIEPVALQAIADALTAMSGMTDLIAENVKALSNDEPIDLWPVMLKYDEYIDDISKAFGYPHENIGNMVTSVARLILIEKLGKYYGGYQALKLTTDPTKKAAKYYDVLFKAYENSPEQYEQIYNDMVASGYFPEDKIKSAIEKRLKDAQGVTSVSDLDERFLAPQQKAGYDSTLDELTRSRLWDKATDEQRQGIKDLLYDLATGNNAGKKIEGAINGGESVGLTETDYMLYRLALEMSDVPNDSGNLGTYTQAEVEAAIRMVPGLDDAERSYLWTAQGKSADSDPFSASEDEADVSGSTMFSAASYDPASETVTLTFRNSGRTYNYEGVSRTEWDEFKNASSKGTYYNTHWK